MQQVYLLTSNQDKIKAANAVFNAYSVEVLPLELDIPEIQAASSVDIARYMVEQAFEKTGKPTIREDHSFYIKELGFPGPFMAYADKAISNEQLLRILATLSSRDAYFELGAAYADQQGKVHTFSYQVPVEMSREAKGNTNLRWERLMMFPGSDKTFAELEEDQALNAWTKNFETIAALIQKKR